MGNYVESVQLTVDGENHVVHCEPRDSLAEVLRKQVGVRAVHVGCEHGMCGSCTVDVDGATARSCLMLAVQADRRSVVTAAALADRETVALHPLQRAFGNHHALQCGFCTPGMLMTIREFLAGDPAPDEWAIREAIAGNLCRCTGYSGIVDAVMCLLTNADGVCPHSHSTLKEAN